eukprot:Amastigsp_a254_152.p3 type:complete len:136 gc:universal Amastigsp_a254_152:838-431(-)
MAAISRACSRRWSSRYPGLFDAAVPISVAAFASPVARMIADSFSCMAFSTRILARSASCCATFFISTACAYSVPNPRFVSDASSTRMLKSAARLRRCLPTMSETFERIVTSCDALNCATTALRTSLTIEGSTRSS